MSIEEHPPLAPSAAGPARARVARGVPARVVAPNRTRYLPPRTRQRLAGETRRGAKPLFVLRRPRPRYRRALDPKRQTSTIIGTAVAGVFGSFLLFWLALLVGTGGVAWAAWNYFTADLPDISNLHTSDFQSTKIYDRHGNLLYEISDPRLGKRTYLSIDQLPPDLINATIAAEDPTFRDNNGVDLFGLLRGAYITASGQGTSGGSTITMQLVRGILLPEKDELSVRRKVREGILAERLTQAYSKDKILETYLNEIYYGSLAYGVAAAAEVYYGVAADKLDLAQAALLAGLPQAPSYYDPHTNYRDAKIRQEYVLRQMVKSGYITQAEADKAAAEDVHPVPPPSELGPPLAPHFVNYVHQMLDDLYGADMVNRGGLRVFTTIDLQYQDLAQRVAAAQIDALKADNASNAALVAMNPRTGEILAMLGSVDYNNPDYGQVNVALAQRQPGSAFKPFTYVTAFKKGYTPASMLPDIPMHFETSPGQFYSPQDYDLQYRGPVSIRTSLANSLNIPSVELLREVGIPDTLDTAHAMGIRTLNDDPSNYGLALTLGGGEVTLLDMTSAYSTFANHGLHMPPVALLDVRDAKGNVLYHFDPDRAKGVQAITPQEAYLMTNILSDNKARTPEFGDHSAMLLSQDAAAKTGTTEDYRDSWIMGYTPNLTVGVWVGNNDNKPMAKVAGARGAGPIWHNFFEGIFANPQMEQVLLQPGEANLPTTFVEPPGIVHATVAAMSGLLPSIAVTDVVKEVFTAGTVPTKEDNLYKMFNICIMHSTPELANEFCPPEFVIQRPYLVLPPEYAAWEKTLPKPLGPPTAVCCAAPTPVPTETPTPSITDTPVPGLAPPINIPYPTPMATPALDDDFPGARVIINSPRPGTSVGGDVTITGSAWANPDVFDYYMIEYGSGTTPGGWVAINGQVTNPVQNNILAVWPTTGLPEGRYILRLSLVSKTGALRRYQVPVEIERSTPKVRLSVPADGSAFYAGDQVVMSADASGPQGLAGVEFYVDDVRVAVAYNAPYQFTWTAQRGTHILTAIAYSPFGRHTSSDPVTVQVSDPPTPTPTPRPSFNIIYPADQASVTGPTLTIVAAAGQDAPVTRVDFYVDGWNLSSVPGTGTFQFNWQTFDGRHTVLAIAYNSAGQEVARSQIVVYVPPAP